MTDELNYKDKLNIFFKIVLLVITIVVWFYFPPLALVLTVFVFAVVFVFIQDYLEYKKKDKK